MVKIICHLVVQLISVMTSVLFGQEVASEKISITGTIQSENKSNLKLAINDVFYSNKVTADTQFTGYKETFKVMRDTRVAILTYTYNFGNSNAVSRRKKEVLMNSSKEPEALLIVKIDAKRAVSTISC